MMHAGSTSKSDGIRPRSCARIRSSVTATSGGVEPSPPQVKKRCCGAYGHCMQARRRSRWGCRAFALAPVRRVHHVAPELRLTRAARLDARSESCGWATSCPTVSTTLTGVTPPCRSPPGAVLGAAEPPCRRHAAQIGPRGPGHPQLDKVGERRRGRQRNRLDRAFNVAAAQHRAVLAGALDQVPGQREVEVDPLQQPPVSRQTRDPGVGPGEHVDQQLHRPDAPAEPVEHRLDLPLARPRWLLAAIPADRRQGVAVIAGRRALQHHFRARVEPHQQLVRGASAGTLTAFLTIVSNCGVGAGPCGAGWQSGLAARQRHAGPLPIKTGHQYNRGARERVQRGPQMVVGVEGGKDHGRRDQGGHLVKSRHEPLEHGDKVVGRGSNGVVYDVGNGRVLKVLMLNGKYPITGCELERVGRLLARVPSGLFPRPTVIPGHGIEMDNVALQYSSENPAAITSLLLRR